MALTATYAPRALRWELPLLGLPVLTLLSRLYEGAHHLSDVLTGLVYATIWVAVTWHLLLRPVGEWATGERRASRDHNAQTAA